jgi:SAM-dependent methyltransferase
LHDEARFFAQECLRQHSPAGLRVLEFGSYDVNGGVGDLLADAAVYVGVDHRPGPGVTHVALFKDFDDPQPFDIFLCLNTLEHDPDWRASLANGLRLLKSGGVAILTVPYNYIVHEVACSPQEGYYQNVPADALAKVMADAGCTGELRILREPPESHVCMVKP